MLISPAFAQATEAAAQQGSMYGTLLQLGLIFVIFYLLLIRPQQKKIKQHEAMLFAIKKGDTVITGGGIYAKVLDADDPVDLKVEIADGIVVTVNRGTIKNNPDSGRMLFRHLFCYSKRNQQFRCPAEMVAAGQSGTGSARRFQPVVGS